MKVKRPAPCHPERMHYGREMCAACYGRAYAPGYRERAAELARASYPRRKAVLRDRARKYRYGITPEDYRRDLIGQAGRCLVCLQVPDRDLVPDHDHATGKVRGLLCQPCNKAIGFLSDNPERARSVARYLEASA